tara:strand:- start:119 stop:544 length:426 start_codon:yes stop_codon:yes gene_type:complete
MKFLLFILFISLNYGNSNYREDNKFSHNQQLSMTVHHLKGVTIPSYSYTNKFKYTFKKNIIADLNIHSGYFINTYSHIWNSKTFSRPSITMDAGINYYPFNNGIFNIEGRTFHDQFGNNNQIISLGVLGFQIKNIYNSKSY